MSNYFPLKESDKREWYLTFKDNLPSLAQQISLDPSEVQDIDNQVAIAIQNIDAVSQKERELEQAVQERDEHREQLMQSLRKDIKRWKNHRAYTKSIGERLNIETKPSVRTVKVARTSSDLGITVSAEVQKVVFNFKKAKALSVAIYSRRAGETDFSLLRQVSSNSYQDIRPNINNSPAEKREYYFVLVQNDKELDRSAIYPVAVAQ